MFSKEELKELKIVFWSGFNDLIKKQKSSNGKRLNWLNYPTDVKSIFIRLEADQNGARVCFDIQHKQDDLRAIIYEQMTELKLVLESTISSETKWFEDYLLLDKTISRIQWENNNVNFYNELDRDKIYTFYKRTLIEFDEFYQNYKDILIALTD